MATIVQKYGGSSLSDLGKLERVAERVIAAKNRGDHVVVVVSAMGKSTEELIALGRRAATPAGASAGAPVRRELDMLVSTGERVSMALLSIAVQARGHAAISFTGSQSGIITTDQHFDARILEIDPHRILEELGRGRIVIVAGYQGISKNREITTLGRGGSDTTAVALAAALGAARCEIYSDVDGVYSADPRSVPDAEHLPELDYDTMQQMAELGAKVLNAQAVDWAKRQGITILARRTSDPLAPDGRTRETKVSRGTARPGLVRAVVAQRRLALLQTQPDCGSHLLAHLAELKLPLLDFVTDALHAQAIVPLLNVPDWSALKLELSKRLFAVDVDDETLAGVSLVGIEVGTNADLISRAFRSVIGRARRFWTTPLCVSCLVPEAELSACETNWHAAFVKHAA